MSPASLNQLWNSTKATQHVFDLEEHPNLPEPAQRYLAHAIAPATPLATAVRLRMHGEIKLQNWVPFAAEEVLCREDMIWKATVWMKGLPIWGSDRLVNGEAALSWKLLGLFPVMTAAGPEIRRSGIGRLQGESVWLPSLLCHESVRWQAADPLHTTATLTTLGETTDLKLSLDASGRLESIQFERWGNPDGAFGYQTFGGVVEQEGRFGGYTIPTRLRLGWYFGSDRFESEGEFFRVTLDEVLYR